MDFHLYYTNYLFKWTFEPYKGYFQRQTTHNCGNLNQRNMTMEGFEHFSCLKQTSRYEVGRDSIRDEGMEDK